VPEDSTFDLGHSESPMFLDMIWQARIGLFDKIKTNGDEKGFWNRLGGSLDGIVPTYVSDSHAFAYELLRGIDHVLLVDAHHDCWREDGLGVEKREIKIYCHNWLRVWLSKGRNRRVTWVRPKWSEGLFEIPKDLRKRVSLTDKIDGKIDRVHICRSGCWTPPWLDKQFVQFVEERKAVVIKLQSDQWDPMVERWTEEFLRSLRDQEETVMRDTFGRFKVGTISSSMFLNSKMELSISC